MAHLSAKFHIMELNGQGENSEKSFHSMDMDPFLIINGADNDSNSADYRCSTIGSDDSPQILDKFYTMATTRKARAP